MLKGHLESLYPAAKLQDVTFQRFYSIYLKPWET